MLACTKAVSIKWGNSNFEREFLNQEGFSRQVKINVLSEKNKSKLSEFLLETSKIICQWGKKNHLMSNRKLT